MSDETKWTRGTFWVKCRGENGPVTRDLQGWQRGLFGLDRRSYYDRDGDRYRLGWVISHLPTGFVVRGVEGPLPLAKLIADKIAETDWNFTDLEQSKSRGEHVKAIMQQHPECTGLAMFDEPTFVAEPSS